MSGAAQQPPFDKGSGDERETLAARIDPAHQVRPAMAEAAAKRPAPVASTHAAASNPSHQAPELRSEPIERHAAELAEQLQHRQADLDRRAAALAAMEAEIDSKIRSARLWFEDQQRELDARQAELKGGGAAEQSSPSDGPAVSEEERTELEARQRELDSRQADVYRQIEELTQRQAETDQKLERLTAREAQLKEFEESIERRHKSIADEREDLVLQIQELDERRAKLHRRTEEMEARDAELRSREAQLAFRRQEIETAIERFEQLGIAEERIEALDAQSAEFQVRSNYLDKAEALLQRDTEALAKRRQEIEDEHRRTLEQFRKDRQKLIDEHEQSRQEAVRRAKQLDHRESELDQREESLKTLRLELEASQREVLEMRLATEETWAQLTGALAPASLMRSIAQTRSRLADHYEHQLHELRERQDELEQFRTELSEQHVQLDTRRTQFAEWQRRREHEIEQQAGRLIAREQELDRQQMHYEALESKWRLERDDYRAEIRQLLTQLRKGILEAAA